MQDCLLTEKDKELPFSWHVVSTMEKFHIIEHPITVVLMRTQEVIISNPESQIIVGAFDVVKAVCFPIGSFIRAVQPFHDLFEWAVVFGYSIVVGKSNDLGDRKGKVFSKLLCKLHCGKRVSAVAVRNEFKVVRQLFKSLEGHAHGEDAGPHAAIVRNLIADDGTAGGIHDQPDKGFHTADFDVGFIGDESVPFSVGILVGKGFDAYSGGLAVVCDLLMGDADVIEILKSLAGFTK